MARSAGFIPQELGTTDQRGEFQGLVAANLAAAKVRASVVRAAITINTCRGWRYSQKRELVRFGDTISAKTDNDGANPSKNGAFLLLALSLL